MSNQTSAEAQVCGECTNWKETKDKCPGWGFCGHPRAPSTRVGEVNVSCRFLPNTATCLIHRR